MRQNKKCLLQFELDFITGNMIAAVKFGGEFACNIADRKKEPSFLSLKKAQAFIRRNAVNPGIKLGVFTKTVNVFMNLNEYFLGQVIGIVMVYYHLANMRIHSLLIRAYQQIESIIPGIGVPDFR